ncbi:MAG: glycoside hydrolase family 95 protein, partial [Acutalibacteraceae bacterium]|nr:glycoside hydrolase family 95 protein [Acutalibacteraceae bacterium]
LFDEKERQAAKKVLLSRGDGGTGWSLAWKINLWARLGDGNHALKLLNNQLKTVPAECDSPSLAGGSYPNLLCAHPPFQIDGNFGAASGIIEMLVQCDKEGNVKLLPALPDSWKNGQVKNLRLPGKKSVSFAWENGKIIYSEIKENVKC